MDSNPGGPPPLQFDTAVPSVVAPSGVITAQGVTCPVCQRAVSAEYFGQSVCDLALSWFARHGVTRS